MWLLVIVWYDLFSYRFCLECWFSLCVSVDRKSILVIDYVLSPSIIRGIVWYVSRLCWFSFLCIGWADFVCFIGYGYWIGFMCFSNLILNYWRIFFVNRQRMDSSALIFSRLHVQIKPVPSRCNVLLCRSALVPAGGCEAPLMKVATVSLSRFL
jgi:hypothetical protein